MKLYMSLLFVFSISLLYYSVYFIYVNFDNSIRCQNQEYQNILKYLHHVIKSCKTFFLWFCKEILSHLVLTKYQHQKWQNPITNKINNVGQCLHCLFRESSYVWIGYTESGPSTNSGPMPLLVIHRVVLLLGVVQCLIGSTENLSVPALGLQRVVQCLRWL